MDYVCKYCTRIISPCNNSPAGLLSHEKQCWLNPDSSNYAFKDCKCERCGKSYRLIDGVSSRFCSKKCANTRDMTLEVKTKISSALHEVYSSIYGSQEFSDTRCLICGREIKISNKYKLCRSCFKEHMPDEVREKLREGGKHSAEKQKDNRRSKIEMMFFNAVKEEYTNAMSNIVIVEGWDTDIYIPEYNLCVAWNGPCHYLPIYGEKSLNRTMNRDIIKSKVFNKYGLNQFIVKDLPDSWPKKKYKNEYKVRDAMKMLKKYIEDKIKSDTDLIKILTRYSDFT